MIKRAVIEIGAYVVLMCGLVLMVTACAPKTVYRDRVVEVSMPVVQPCALNRPTHIPTLQERYPDPAWASMDARQKSAAVGKQALDLRGFGEQLDAATAGCE